MVSQRFALFSVALFSCATFFVGALPLFAQEDVGVKMQPTLIEERVDPGAAVGGNISITNVSNDTQTYFLIARDVDAVDLEGRPTFKAPDETGMMLSSWVSMELESVTVNPNQTVRVGYTIIIPENAPPGGHFAGIFADRRADEIAESGAGVGFQVGTLMNIQVNGEILEDVQIREFSTTQAFYTTPEVAFTALIENNGTVLQRPRGALIVTDMLGNDVATLTVNDNAGGVLPNSDRLFNIDWTGEGFHFGRYDALMSLGYGIQDSSTVFRETSFWIIPVKELLIGLGALLAVLILFYLWTKLYVRGQLKKAGISQTRAAKEQKTFAQRLAFVLIVFLTITILSLMVLFLFFA